MNIRRGLIRIWVVLTVLLLLPLGIAVYLEWESANQFGEVEVGGHQFKVSMNAFYELRPLERYQVLKRIGWLNGIDGEAFSGSMFEAYKAWRYENPALAKMPDTRGDQPLSPKLESLARGEFIRPDLLSFIWGLTWLLPLAVVIPLLWVALYVGFWIASGFQIRPARKRWVRAEGLEPPRDEPAGT
jgi:hypothetical protein